MLAAMENPGPYIDKVNEQIGYAQADLRSFVYLRTQPAWGTTNDHGLGGGNFAGALLSFALVSTLAKCYRAVTQPEEFVLQADERLKHRCPQCRRKSVLHETNEANAFSSYTQWLKSKSIDLGVEKEVAGQVWNEFRNWLFHKFNTKHLLVTWRIQTRFGTTAEADSCLRGAIQSGATPIVRAEDGRFVFHVDLFYALLDDIRPVMTELLTTSEDTPNRREVLDSLLVLA